MLVAIRSKESHKDKHEDKTKLLIRSDHNNVTRL
jgi:hypothetical protein